MATKNRPSVVQMLVDDAAMEREAIRRDKQYSYHSAYNTGAIRCERKSVRVVGSTKWIVYVHIDERGSEPKTEVKFRKAQRGEDVSGFPAYSREMYKDLLPQQ